MASSNRHPAIIPTTTAHVARLRLFQPTQRPQPLTDQRIETAHGAAYITGRLGQRHADVFEALLYCAEARGRARVEMPEGKEAGAGGNTIVLVDPARVKRHARIRSGQQFKDICKNLVEASIVIEKPVELACMGHLVDGIKGAFNTEDGSPILRGDPFGHDRQLQTVTFGAALETLIGCDPWKVWGRDPSPLAALPNGVAQAVARYVLTHRSPPLGGWTLDVVLKAVAGDLDSVSLCNRRRDLRAAADQLAAAGVLIDPAGERVTVAKNEAGM